MYVYIYDRLIFTHMYMYMYVSTYTYLHHRQHLRGPLAQHHARRAVRARVHVRLHRNLPAFMYVLRWGVVYVDGCGVRVDRRPIDPTA